MARLSGQPQQRPMQRCRGRDGHMAPTNRLLAHTVSLDWVCRLFERLERTSHQFSTGLHCQTQHRREAAKDLKNNGASLYSYHVLLGPGSRQACLFHQRLLIEFRNLALVCATADASAQAFCPDGCDTGGACSWQTAVAACGPETAAAVNSPVDLNSIAAVACWHVPHQHR